MHPALKLRHIRLFLDVAATGSLSAAARLRGLSQPALSKSLHETEVLLGGPLFHRQGRRMILTQAGEQVRRHAQEALISLDAAALALQPAGQQDRLAVGLLPTVSTRFFPEVALRFIAAQPLVTLCIETGPHPYLLQRLRDRHIDLMVGRMPQAAEMAGLQFAGLYEEPIVLARRNAHPLSRHAARDLLLQAPLILPSRDAIIRRVVDDYLAALGLSGLRAAVETSTLAVGRGLLLASDAVWFISRGVIANELASGQLETVDLGASYLSGSVGMTRLQSRTGSPPAEVLNSIVRQQGVGWSDGTRQQAKG